MKGHRKLQAFLLIFALTALLFATPALADMGPKPSMHIRLDGLDGGICYATLLSEHDSTFRSEVWDGEPGTKRYGDGHSDSLPDAAAWEAFAYYEDPDGFFFLQKGWRVDETKAFEWSYDPPGKFKILLYWPETNEYAVSGICSSYATDSYFTADVGELRQTSAKFDGEPVSVGLMNVRRTYRYWRELGTFTVRVAITVFVEVCIGTGFGFVTKKQRRTLILVNIATQILLNAGLDVLDHFIGVEAFLLYLLPLELVVFAVEAVIYCIVLPKISSIPRKKSYYVLYSLAANAASFGIGFVLSLIVLPLISIMASAIFIN